MENQFQIFQHEEFGKVRTLVIDGEPYFAGKDVATALKYKDASRAIRDHVDEEDKKIVDLNRGVNRPPIADAVSGGWIKNEVMFINESGLYSLILSSKLPDAKKFKRWVTSEVLPTIRKTGSYSLPKVKNAVAVQNPNPLPEYHKIIKIIDKTATQIVKCFGTKYGIAFATVASMIEENHGINLTKIKALIPPADYEIGIYTPTQIGKKIGKSPQYVNKKLVELGLQEKDGDGYKLTEKGKEYAEAMPFERNGHAGYQIKWKAEILKFFD